MKSRFQVAKVEQQDRHTFVELRAFYAKDIPDHEQFSNEGPEATLTIRLDTPARAKHFKPDSIFDVTVIPVL